MTKEEKEKADRRFCIEGVTGSPGFEAAKKKMIEYCKSREEEKKKAQGKSHDDPS